MRKHAVEGVCPLCNSNDIEFGVVEVEIGEGVHQPCTCNNCGATFDEWYNLEFDGQWNIYDNDNKHVQEYLGARLDNGN